LFVEVQERIQFSVGKKKMKRLPASLLVLFFAALIGRCFAFAQVLPIPFTSSLKVLAVGIDPQGSELPNLEVPTSGKFTVRFGVRNIYVTVAKSVVAGVTMMPQDMLLLSADCDEVHIGDMRSGELYTKDCSFEAPERDGVFKINFAAAEHGADPAVGSIMVSVGPTTPVPVNVVSVEASSEIVSGVVGDTATLQLIATTSLGTFTTNINSLPLKVTLTGPSPDCCSFTVSANGLVSVTSNALGTALLTVTAVPNSRSAAMLTRSFPFVFIPRPNAFDGAVTETLAIVPNSEQVAPGQYAQNAVSFLAGYSGGDYYLFYPSEIGGAIDSAIHIGTSIAQGQTVYLPAQVVLALGIRGQLVSEYKLVDRSNGGDRLIARGRGYISVKVNPGRKIDAVVNADGTITVSVHNATVDSSYRVYLVRLNGFVLPLQVTNISPMDTDIALTAANIQIPLTLAEGNYSIAVVESFRDGSSTTHALSNEFFFGTKNTPAGLGTVISSGLGRTYSFFPIPPAR
jgi:hypothetical protein